METTTATKKEPVLQASGELKFIPLSDILIGKTNPRDPADLTEKALKELIDSVKEKGVIQPILVRPKNAKYELVCGERRYQSSKFAGRTDIPCNVREMSDEEAFELQIIENLERKDVHPFHEAVAFKKLLDTKKYSIKDLAGKFAKAETFIAARLKLNDLIPEFQKDFLSNLMTVGHAVLAARLTAGDQKTLFEELFKNTGRNKDTRDYDTVKDFEQSINNKIVNNLSSAPFKKDDEKLVPLAGACTNCLKRSGANTLLFADIKEADRCFDRVCFFNKTNTFLVNTLTTLIEEHPEVSIIASYFSDPAPHLKKICTDKKVKILQQHQDFRDANKTTPGAVKAFWISGKEAGTYKYIVPGSSRSEAGSGKKKLDEMKPAEQIKAIEARETRATELDAEKIWNNIRLAALEDDCKMLSHGKPLNPVENSALAMAIYDSLGYHEKDYFKEEVLKYDGHDYNTTELAKVFEKLPVTQFNILCRLLMKEKLFTMNGSHEKSNTKYFGKLVAQEYKPEAIKQIEDDQSTAAVKRKGRVNTRIEALKINVKPAATKKTAVKKTATKKAQPKKAVKKNAKKTK